MHAPEDDEKRLIYVVEDERELREILQDVLSHVGHRIRAAPDAHSLLELMAQETPDLVLMDIGLPDMSGWDLRKILQDDARHKDVPVIAVTGYGGPALEAKILRSMHFADYLRKPYSLVDLMNRVERVLDDQQKTAPTGQGSR
jgi:CheY-like chemotaxis protein